ncbi:MAG: DUF5063 domain-containing protein [Muribaculaceae bacterium]|nr:DUF5063 domain-containing protein [Muribaculaceae bacterium]
MSDNKSRLYEIVALAKEYCELCEDASSFSKGEFTDRSLNLLPRIYWNFFDIDAGVALEDLDYFSNYVDEELYEQIRGRIAAVMGVDDIFLETFEEDMQYSETPISASIAEGMADIFQPLFNFINIVKDSEGEQLEDAYISCKEDFENYWSQTLCNIQKALNNIKYGQRLNDENYD